MVVFSKSKIKILKFVLENRDKEFSIRALADNINLDYKSANLAIKNLEEDKVLSIKKIGKSLICRLTNNFSPLIYYVEALRKEEFTKKRNFKILVKDLELIQEPIVCILFGSYVNGDFNKNSDIDLLFITEKEKEIEKVINRFPFNIHSTYVTYREFISMVNSKEFSVVSEVLKKNVILIGIEEFYRVMKHAK